MKTSVPIIALTAALSLPCRIASAEQEPGDIALQEAVQKTQAEARKFEIDARQQYEQTRQQLEQLGKRLADDVPRYVGGLQNIVQNAMRRSPVGPGKILVIRTTDGDAKTQANFEEDLSVMSHIFEKAIDEKLGGAQRGRTAMGIDVFFVPGGSPVRSLYLDGYGALFMLNVDFPLLGPPAKSEEPNDKPPMDSTWEEARHELYGQSAEPRRMGGPVVEFDETKVNTLKDALLEALKNATNLRNLKPDDAVTVCVFGGASPGPGRTGSYASARVMPKDSGEEVPSDASVIEDKRTGQRLVLRSGENTVSTRNTTMTIRVKKSDIDAFAKGKLNLDEFRKKASVTAYTGGFVGWGGSASTVGFRSFGASGGGSTGSTRP